MAVLHLSSGEVASLLPLGDRLEQTPTTALFKEERLEVMRIFPSVHCTVTGPSTACTGIPLPAGRVFAPLTGEPLQLMRTDEYDSYEYRRVLERCQCMRDAGCQIDKIAGIQDLVAFIHLEIDLTPWRRSGNEVA
ncbi:hypothetical protein [Paraburkholderia terrae]|uniref:hypothetical protein n=1 Tax=Paraburkholderia terrae TaxID=311230 RepID=UPI00336548B1